MHILLLILIPFVFGADLEQFVSDEGFACKNDVPALTIGDHHVTEKNTLSLIKEEHDVFILGVSEADCYECCKGEVILAQVKRLFEIGDIEYEGKPLPIVRLDVSKYSEQVEEEKIYLDGVPRIFVYFKGSYYMYIEGDNLNLFLMFLNKVLYPLAELKTEQQVEIFASVENEFIESTPFYKTKYRGIEDLIHNMTKVTRVLALISEDSKYTTKIEELEAAARKLVERTDLRVGIVRDSGVVGKFKETMGENWFNETSKNTVVLFRDGVDPGDMQRFYDVETDDYDFESWISFSSLDEVEEFTPGSLNIMTSLDMPIFLAFLHENFTENVESKELYRKLQFMSYQFPHLLFTFTDDPEYDYLKEYMAIFWTDLPALGLFNNEGMLPVTFPRNQPFTIDNLVTFFDSFMNGTVNSNEFSLPSPNLDFGLNIPHGKRVVAVSSTF
jgi:hypothetical protein